MRTPDTTREKARANSEDSLGLGFDAALVLVLFGAAGYGLDQVFETLPLLTIVLVLVAAVGLFARFKYRYDARMDEHEATRRAAASGRAARSRAPEDRAA